MELTVGARQSPLSQKQIEEVLTEIRQFYPEISFQPILLETFGDKDQKTSLRDLEKTNFFTKEIDELLLKKKCHIAIHSAKDLPDPLPKGLSLIALTKGVDPSDSLVFRADDSLSSLAPKSIIATSSVRREEAVKALRPDFIFQDIRGTIDQRLQQLFDRKVDGVVIAEAALIRLNLTHLNRIKLPAETVPLQGKLAILAREDDLKMKQVFSSMDSRKVMTSLYLGIDPPRFSFEDRRLIHRPIISIVPKKPKEIALAFQDLPLYTHLIFTSKTAVNLFFQALPHFLIPLQYLNNKTFIAVGKATQYAIEQQGFKVTHVAKEETSEGLIQELQAIDRKSTFFFWPHSSGSRPIIPQFLESQGFRFKECILYSTIPAPHFDMPHPSLFEEIIFTSPSTVDAFFLHHQPHFKEKKIFTAIGPITESSLAKYRLNEQNSKKTGANCQTALPGKIDDFEAICKRQHTQVGTKMGNLAKSASQI